MERESDPPEETPPEPPPRGANPDGGPDGRRAPGWPLARRLAVIPAAICGLQALALAVIGVLSLADPGQGLAGAAVEAAVFGLIAAGLVIVAVGLVRLKAWARGPLIALELIALLTAVAFAGLGTVLGWGLAAASVVAIGVTLSRPVAVALEGESDADAEA